MSVILGAVQGVAEFLPISSSGHLVLLQHFFGMAEPDALFDVLLHFATLIAVCVVYYRDILGMIRELIGIIRDVATGTVSYEGRPPEDRRLILLIIVGTLPLLAVLPFRDKIESLGNSAVFVSCALLVTGCVLFLADRMKRGRKTAMSATLADVLLVGVAQGFATIPGLSRSGCTISAGIARGFDRGFAVRYSFLLSLPAVLGATLLELADVVKAGGIDAALLPKYLVGMVIAGVVGYASIRLVNLLAKKGKFGVFAWYCWIAGLVALIASIAGFTFVPAA